MGKLKSLRLVDSHASQIMSGYRKPELGAINKIWPIIDVDTEKGKFFEFAADQSVIRAGLERALGDERKRVDVRVGEGAFSTDEVSLEIPIYDRELDNVPEERRQRFRDHKAQVVQGIHLLNLEFNVAAFLKDATKYDASVTEALTGTNQWKDPGSNPYKDMRRWLRTMAGKLGVPPTSLSIAMALKPFEALQDHAKTEGRLAPTGREATPQVLANIVGCKAIEILGGMYASSFNPDDPKDVTFSFIFDDEVITFLEIEDPGAGDPLWGGVARKKGYPIATEYREERISADILASDDNYGFFQQSNKRGFLARTASGL